VIRDEGARWSCPQNYADTKNEPQNPIIANAIFIACRLPWWPNRKSFVVKVALCLPGRGVVGWTNKSNYIAKKAFTKNLDNCAGTCKTRINYTESSHIRGGEVFFPTFVISHLALKRLAKSNFQISDPARRKSPQQQQRVGGVTPSTSDPLPQPPIRFDIYGGNNYKLSQRALSRGRGKIHMERESEVRLQNVNGKYV